MIRSARTHPWPSMHLNQTTVARGQEALKSLNEEFLWIFN
jgi:hypothetical protein